MGGGRRRRRTGGEEEEEVDEEEMEEENEGWVRNQTNKMAISFLWMRNSAVQLS